MTEAEGYIANTYAKKVNDIFREITKTASEDKQEQVKQLWGKVIDAWNDVLLGSGGIPEIETALNIWATIQLEVIDLARPAPKPKRQYKTRLTKRQEDFVDHYKRGCSAAKAARQAGYSPRTARQVGYENLRKPHIARLIRGGLGK